MEGDNFVYTNVCWACNGVNKVAFRVKGVSSLLRGSLCNVFVPRRYFDLHVRLLEFYMTFEKVRYFVGVVALSAGVEIFVGFFSCFIIIFVD